MRKISKKLIRFVLIISICINMSVTAFATDMETVTYTDNTELQLRTNYNFIQIDDLSAVEYTYEEGEKTYLVKESANEDLSFIETMIYEISGDNIILVESYTTSVSIQDGIMFLEKNDDGIITIDEIDIGAGELSSQASEFNPDNSGSPITCDDSCIDTLLSETPNAIASNTHSGPIRYCYVHNHYFTYWFYSSTFNSSNYTNNFTVTVLTSIVTGIITKNIAAAIVTGVSTVVSVILLNSITNLYYTTEVHHLWEVTSDREYIGWAVGIRHYTNFYIDSARTRPLVETGFSEYHDPVYYPTTCMMT